MTASVQIRLRSEIRVLERPQHRLARSGPTGLQSELDRSSRTAWGVMSANQLDQAGETTSMPTSEAAKQSRASYATRTVRSVFTDNALARWIASRLRSSVGTL